jgi:hypothetical protein
MSNTVEFTINARDQASRAVETVQNKLKSFGSDLAKGVLSFAGPMALVTGAIGMIGSAIEEYKTKIKEAVDNASKLKDTASDLGVSVEEYQKLSNAADNAGISLNKVVKAYQEINGVLEKAKTNAGSQAMLEALGFDTKDIVDGNVKAIDVIEKLGAAMLGASNDTDAFKVATAVLGETLAKDLLPVLKQAGKLASGFNEDAGLSEEEADLLRNKKIDEQKKKNREAVKIARREAANEFLTTDPEGQKIVARKQAEAARTANGGAAAVVLGTGTIAGMEDVQNEVLRILKERRDAEKTRAQEANKSAADAVLARSEQTKAEQEAQDFADKAVADAIAGADKVQADLTKDAEKKKADQKKKEDADRDALGKALDEQSKLDADAGKDASKMTLSSLRDIGGGLAGEALVNNVDLQRETLDIQNKILIELQKLNIKTLQEAPGSIDFTKTQNIA